MQHIFNQIKDKRTPVVQKVSLVVHVIQAAISAFHHFRERVSAPLVTVPIAPTNGPDAWEVETRNGQ